MKDVILLGDNTKTIKQIPTEHIDLVVTSPPYDDIRKYEGFTWDYKILGPELYRVLKTGGRMVWVTYDTHKGSSDSLTSFKTAIYFVEECGFKLRTMIYQKAAFPMPSPNFYLDNFEYKFVFTKGRGKTFNKIKDKKNKNVGKVKHPVKREVSNKTAEWAKRRVFINSQFGLRGTIWKYGFKKPPKKIWDIIKDHPAMFPIELARDHIKSWTNPGEIVLDPFMGSGTTAHACIEEGRHYIGLEISEKYVEIINKRIEILKDIVEGTTQKSMLDIVKD
jgi:site-specific DNA-methyltransferase (adenine-specific)